MNLRQIKYRFFTAVLIGMLACNSESDKIIVYNELYDSIFNENLKYTIDGSGDTMFYNEIYNRGRAEIKLFRNNEYVKSFKLCSCAKKSDSLKIEFNLDGYNKIYVSLYGENYSSILKYITDVNNTYDQGSYNGTSITLGVSDSKLKLKNMNYVIGEELLGHIQIRTNEYTTQSKVVQDNFEGYFKCIIH